MGAVTTGVNVEGIVTAQHNSSDSVCCLVTAVKGTAGDRFCRVRECVRWVWDRMDRHVMGIILLLQK